MKLEYDHIGIPTKVQREGMVYFPEYKVWTSVYQKSDYRIEWLFFEEGTPLHPLIQEIPHVGLIVKDIHLAVAGKKILLAPVLYDNFYMAFIEADGAPVELIQYQ